MKTELIYSASFSKENGEFSLTIEHPAIGTISWKGPQLKNQAERLRRRETFNTLKDEEDWLKRRANQIEKTFQKPDIELIARTTAWFFEFLLCSLIYLEEEESIRYLFDFLQNLREFSMEKNKELVERVDEILEGVVRGPKVH